MVAMWGNYGLHSFELLFITQEVISKPPIVKILSFDVRWAGLGSPYNNMLLGPVWQFLPGVACIYEE